MYSDYYLVSRYLAVHLSFLQSIENPQWRIDRFFDLLYGRERVGETNWFSGRDGFYISEDSYEVIARHNSNDTFFWETHGFHGFYLCRYLPLSEIMNVTVKNVKEHAWLRNRLETYKLETDNNDVGNNEVENEVENVFHSIHFRNFGDSFREYTEMTDSERGILGKNSLGKNSVRDNDSAAQRYNETRRDIAYQYRMIQGIYTILESNPLLTSTHRY